MSGVVVALRRDRPVVPGSELSARTRAAEVVEIQALRGYLASRVGVDWTTRSNWERLQIGMNLRRPAIREITAGLHTTVRRDAAIELDEALGHLDAVAREHAPAADLCATLAARTALTSALCRALAAAAAVVRPISLPVP